MPFELRTPRLLLRDFAPTDFEAVHAYGSDPEVVRFQPWGPNSEDDTRAFLERARTAAQTEPRALFELAIVDLESNALLGGAGLTIDASGTQGMIGYCFAKHVWGRGVATEAGQALLRFGFQECELHRVWATCDPVNHRSRRVLEKLGLRQEGHLRENVLVRSEFRDTLMYGLLRSEWSP